MTGGQALVGQLLREGVRDLFGIPGVQLDWAVDALSQVADQLTYYVPRHEQAASYMADGYARTTGREGVFMVVPGPGVLNALSGLATAYACGSRVLCLAGQIPLAAIGRGQGLLHEIPDQSGILRSLTKWHALVRHADEIPERIHEAFAQLRSGQPRPVALEIPQDMLEARCAAPLLDAAIPVPTMPDDAAIAQAAEMLRRARFPVIQAGGGAVNGPALRRLAELLQAPVVMTDGARGLIDDRHPLALTGLGGRAVFPRADLVLVAGSRFLDARAQPIHAGPDCRYIYLNLDPSHAAAPRASGLLVEGDAGEGLRLLAEALTDLPQRPSRTAQMQAVKGWCAAQLTGLAPQWAYIDALRQGLEDDDILVSELTQIGYFANVAFEVRAAHSYLTPGYQGTLGYGFPTALGAALGNPHRRTVSLNGDGGFGWGLQELATLARYRPNLTVIVFADGHFGNVRRIQRRSFGREFATDLTNPDFCALAAAFGIEARRAETPGELLALLAERRSGPLLIEAPVGELPSPWPLIHSFVPPEVPAPPMPLGV